MEGDMSRATYRPVTGFPGLRLLRRLRPNPDHRRTPRFAPRGGPDRFPRSLPFGRQDRRPAFLLRPPSRRSRSTHRVPPRARSHRRGGPGTRGILAFPCTASPAHIHRVGAGWSLEEIRPLVRSRYASLPRLPGPRRPIVPARPVVVRLLPSSPAVPGSDCPQLPRTAATARWQGLAPTRSDRASWRTTSASITSRTTSTTASLTKSSLPSRTCATTSATVVML
jgi:hypothetical protein